VEALVGVDACCEPVYTVGEALDSPPMQALGMLIGLGLLPPIYLSNQAGYTVEPAPALGQHTASYLTELGYTPAAVEALRQQGVI
jgi:crotonobetainyl-CoA:carnitine CoA-transferase CaiB-like acyl-CoA transferase